MRRPARSPSALLTLQFRNDISEPWMSDWVGTVLSMNLPLYSIYPHSRNAMTSRPIKKTPAIRSADRFPDFPPGKICKTPSTGPAGPPPHLVLIRTHPRPRPRGAPPGKGQKRKVIPLISPLTRGSTSARGPVDLSGLDFPANAGLHPEQGLKVLTKQRFPRRSGW